MLYSPHTSKAATDLQAVINKFPDVAIKGELQHAFHQFQGEVLSALADIQGPLKEQTKRRGEAEVLLKLVSKELRRSRMNEVERKALFRAVAKFLKHPKNDLFKTFPFALRNGRRRSIHLEIF